MTIMAAQEGAEASPTTVEAGLPLGRDEKTWLAIMAAREAAEAPQDELVEDGPVEKPVKLPAVQAEVPLKEVPLEGVVPCEELVPLDDEVPPEVMMPPEVEVPLREEVPWEEVVPLDDKVSPEPLKSEPVKLLQGGQYKVGLLQGGSST